MTTNNKPLPSSRAWLHGGLWSWAQLAVGVLATVVQARLAVTTLSAAQSGIWFVMLSFAGLIALMDFGLNATLARELAFDEDPAQRSRLMVTAERTLCRAAVIAWLILTLLGGLYLHLIAPNTMRLEVIRAWGVFVVGAGFALHANAASSALYGTGQLSADRQIRIAAQLIGLVFAYAAITLEPSLRALCIAWTLQNIVLWGLEWRAVAVRVPRFAAQFDAVLSKRLLNLGLRWWAMAIGGYLILNTDNLVIAATLGAAQVSDYALLARISTILQPLALVFVTSAAPLISRLSVEGRNTEMQRILEQQIRLALLLVSLAGAIIAAAPEALLTIWVGPGHFVGYPILTVFLVMLTLEVHHVAHAITVMATGKLPFAAWAIGSGVLNIVFSLLLVQHLGLLGVALGTMLAQLLTNNWFTPIFTLRSFGIDWLRYVRMVLLPALLTGASLYAVAQLARAASQNWNALGSVIAVTLTTTSVAMLVFVITSSRFRRKIA